MKIKKEHLLLASILAIGIVARLLKFDEPIMGTDVAAFSRLGKNLIEYGRYAFGENYNMGVFFPPGYPVFVGILNLAIDDLFLSAKLVSLVAGCISIILAYLIGRELYNRDAGLFAALAFAVYPLILIVSIQGWSDALFFCFLLLSIYTFLVSLRRDDLLIYLLLGISFGISYLVRPEGMFLFFMPFLNLFGLFDGRLCFKKRYLLKISALLIVFLLVISPYVRFLKGYTGKLALSGKSNISLLLGELSGDNDYHKIVNAPDNLYDKAAFTLNEEKNRLTGWDPETNRSLKEYILKDPLNLSKRYLKNVLQQVKVLLKLLLPIILPLFLFFFNREAFNKRTNLIFAVFPLFYFLIYPLFVIIEKQTLLIVLFLIFPASAGFAGSEAALRDLLNYIGMGRNGFTLLLQKGIKYIIIILLVSGSLAYLKYSSFDKGPKPVEHKLAGYYLKESVSDEYEKLNVMSRKPLVSFYSGARFTMLPYADIDDVIGFAKLYNVDYIVVDERLLSKWDYYDKLLQMQRYSPDVELVYEDSSGKLIRLFKIKK